MINKDLVIIKNNELRTTSLKVAELFHKKHENVLKAIRKVGCSQEDRLVYFDESSYLNEQNKEQPMYEITRDGLMYLIMGFTGKKAEQAKSAFIKAFNRMEKELRSNSTSLSPAQFLVHMANQLAEQEKVNSYFDTRLKRIEEKSEQAIKELELNVPIDPELELPQDISRRKQVNQIVRAYAVDKGMKTGEVWNKLYYDFNYLMDKNVTTCAKNRKVSVLDYVEEIGYMEDLYKLAYKLFRV